MKDKDKSIEKIYEMYHSPVLTPYVLLSNAKEPDYEYVKYYANDHGLMVEMLCHIDNESVTFFYQFDRKDFLQEAYYTEDGEKVIFFKREDILEEAKKEYYARCESE